jgi:hypothetical protein
MANGLSLDITANTREAVRGAKDIGDALGDVADSLDDLAKDGSKSTDKLERSFDDTRKETAKVERGFKDLADTAKRESNTAGDAIGRNVKRGTDDAQDGIKEIGNEAASTAKESAASFDGSAASIGDAFQEVAANAFSSFGPAGLIAGVAAAAGIGVVFAQMEKGKEETQEFKETVAELTAELIETGKTGGPALEFVVDKLKELATVSEDGETSLEDLRKTADGAKRPFDDLAQAYSGMDENLDDLVKTNEDLLDSLNDQAGAIDTTTSAGVAAYKEIQNRIVAQEQYNGFLSAAKDSADLAAEGVENYARAGGPALDAKRVQIENLNESYDDAAGAVDDFINKETGVFDVEAYVSSMEARGQALRDYVDNLESSGLSPAAKSYLESQGQEAAAKFLAGYVAASPGVKSRLDAVWSEAGRSNSGSFTRSLQAGMPATIRGPRVIVDTPNVNGIYTAAQAALTRKGPLKISAQATFGRSGKLVDG